jgi:hypothetical protein
MWEKMLKCIHNENLVTEIAMSLRERNQFLEILVKNGATRDQIKFIMNDVKDILPPSDGLEDEWDPLDDEEAEIFVPERTEDEVEQLIEASVLKKERAYKANEMVFYHRLLEKQKEIQEHEEAEKLKTDSFLGIDLAEEHEVEKDDPKPSPKKKEVVGFVTVRYGRSPLHEAIATGDLERAEQYIRNGQLLTSTDNNGYTAEEMAYHLSYKEATVLFKSYKKKNNDAERIE